MFRQGVYKRKNNDDFFYKNFSFGDIKLFSVEYRRYVSEILRTISVILCSSVKVKPASHPL